MKFEDLPESARDSIIEKHRDMDVIYDDWWDSVYSFFKEDMLKIGIEVDRIYFSGFSSQGDGAMFEGRVCDWEKFLTHINAPECYRHKEIRGDMTFSVRHSGHYYHSNSTRYSFDAQWSNEYVPDCLRHHVMEALIGECEDGLPELERSCEEAFKGHMDDLYTQLKEEYDYLTSDEHIIESLEANDMMEEEINEYLESTKESTEDCMAPY